MVLAYSIDSDTAVEAENGQEVQEAGCMASASQSNGLTAAKLPSCFRNYEMKAWAYIGGFYGFKYQQ